ncbi:hypothetical protein K0M31_017082 [Melipona bicolor]|uniref:Uncharacterized protein n=1 Tax=Melipona bicolor TaxID=60889 RepID=A0AA40FEG9_9HYME|nr:hypothetical protein K0M31_017082 [Melipona bicolor]
MSEKKVDTEIVQKQYTNDASLIDETEIIDVSVFDFDDSNGWLYIPSEYKMESTVHDLYTWLRTEPELSFSASRKSIDTRTFTRSKKRSSRTSFESILESLSSPVSNTWRTSNFSNIDENFSKYSDITTANKKEAVPPMLKMALNANSNFLPEESVTSGQESMEVFLNMSHSKGIDSFINLVEPGLNDPLMNISQPSIFYSSIISLPKDDSLHSTESSKHEESLNVTRCSQEIDKCEGAKDLNINETFLKVNESDNNITSYCLSTTNKTFTNKSDVEKDINETYNTDVTPKMVVLSSSDKDRFSTTKLSSTYVNKNDDTQILQLENNERKESCNLNTTYPSAFKKAENSSILSTTYCTENIENAISNTTLTETSDMQYDKDQVYNFQKSTICDVPKNAVAPMFKLPAFQSTPKSTDTESRTITESFESSRVYNTTLNLNFKASTLLRKELLSEIYKTGDHRLDCAFNHGTKEHQSGKPKKEIESETLSQNVKDDIPAENKYNTYRKESSINKIKSHAETTDEAGACIKNLPDKKYYTFTKKGNNHGGKTDMENAESLDNADATFTKPFPKPQKRKQHIPRMLSKLPQFLQKSNPNLVSNSLKTVNITSTNASNYGYMKGSQPNIVKNVEKSLANKSYSLGKMRSGSEQRLLELNAGVGELQMLGVGGSTESIESTQSAHSAPDLDDRLSTCSDSSHNSYITQPMNIEQLHQIVRMQEESLKQDVTSRLNKRVLENTWIDVKKDLPSPILKNGVDNCDSNSLSTKFNVTTSSPIESPMRSSQSNTDGQSTETTLKQQNEVDVKKVEVFNKPITKVENKTRLRQPTNWNMGSRSTNPMSAIPRPPSRIPAPRFVRPTVKNIQGDIKRGYT